MNEFGSVVERHRRELLAHCYRMLGSLPDAEDAVQETLLRAWRYRDSLKQGAPLRPWHRTTFVPLMRRKLANKCEGRRNLPMLAVIRSCRQWPDSKAL